MNEQALEMARCVEINIDNMVRMMPALAAHPLLPIVKKQLRECIEALETEQPQVAGLAGLRAQYDGSQRTLSAVMAEHTETVTELALKTAAEKQLLDALDDVINQACCEGDLVDSMALSAYADAMRLLEEYGRLEIRTDRGRRVIAVRPPPATQEKQHD